MEEEIKNSLLVMRSETGIRAIDDESRLTSIDSAADSLKDINFLSSSGKLLKRILEKILSGKNIFINTKEKRGFLKSVEFCVIPLQTCLPYRYAGI